MKRTIARLLRLCRSRSLLSRVLLILVLGLFAAHALSVWWVLQERGSAARAMMVAYWTRDVASSVALLERLPAPERPLWIGKLERPNYRYVLGAAVPTDNDAPFAREIRDGLSAALGDEYRPVFAAGGADASRLRLQLTLSDGEPLRLEILQPKMSIDPWLMAVLAAQLALLVLFGWMAVRSVVRPLRALAAAADVVSLDQSGVILPEQGPDEVARAAVAFNAMQRRIAEHAAERIQILAAISHDLQAPITRMKLRADLLESAPARDKLHADLEAMQSLVEEGIAYARSASQLTEAPCRIDLQALLDSIACDYLDAGQNVRLRANDAATIVTHPNALRRIVCNLIENALKFAGEAEVCVTRSEADEVSIAVLDRGPGIDPSELPRVLKPFYRIEHSRSRDTGGTGLGLAIANQLAAKLGGRLTLANRPAGGLEAAVVLPSHAAP